MMLLLTSLLFALADSVSSLFSTETSDLTDLYPPLWKESPRQLNDYRVVNGVYNIDPWRYPERMGLYKILITQTATYFQRFAAFNEADLLWGLALQHGWQFKTDRLADPTNKTQCGRENGDHMCISVDSWWACINYYLNIIPFLGAVEAGVLDVSSDQVKLLPPPKDQMHFCYDVTSCQSSSPDSLTKWKIFFEKVKEPLISWENLLKYIWDAHKTTLQEIGNRFDNRYLYLPKPEVDFAKSWLTAVSYIATILFETTLEKTFRFQQCLPPIFLKSFVHENFTDCQNRVLYSLELLEKIDIASDHEFHTFMEYLMQFSPLRKMANILMELMIKNYIVKPQELEDMISKII